jgi:hypothetical protein
MYASGEEPRVDDSVVRVDNGDEGVVYELVPGGAGGEEAVMVRWTTLHEFPSGSGIRRPKASSRISTRLLRRV